jgi:ferredoxin
VHLLKVNTDTTRVQPELGRELIGPRRPREGGEVREQPRSRRLSEHVGPTVRPTRRHAREFPTEPPRRPAGGIFRGWIVKASTGLRAVTYVIAEPCIGTKDNSCVEVCPVDCIHPTPDEPDYDKVEMLYIDPEECIDCDACVEACPVDAIFAEDQVPEEWQRFIDLNAAYYRNQAA